MPVMERRKFMRIGTTLTADYWAKGPSMASGQAEIRDFCREGLGARFSGVVGKGECVDLTLKVPGEEAPILATGEIAWTVEQEDSNKVGGGIRFVSIQPLDLARLLDFVYARWLGIRQGGP